MDVVLAQLFNGLSYGSILLLAAVGLAFSFGLMNIINMAHGEFIMTGAYTAFVLQNVFVGAFGDTGLTWYFILAVPIAFVVAALMGMALEATLIRRLYGRPLDTLLATWGVSLLLQQLALLKGFDLGKMKPNDPDFLHIWIETAKLVFADREAFYGDPDFVDVPMQTLLSDAYNDDRRKLIDLHKASLDQRPGKVEGYGGGALVKAQDPFLMGCSETGEVEITSLKLLDGLVPNRIHDRWSLLQNLDATRREFDNANAAWRRHRPGRGGS